jgi:RNA polymerase sigma-70 factor (ECF subfamily)
LAYTPSAAGPRRPRTRRTINLNETCSLPAEADLLTRVRAREPAALAEFYDRHAPALYAYIYRRVGERQLAEDLTADVFVRSLDALQHGRFAAVSLQAWLYRLAHNRVVDHYRRAGRAPLHPLDEAVPAPDNVPEAARRRSDQAWMRAALQRLTPDQQQIIALRFGEGLSAGAIAAALGKTEEAVRALQHRALAALRRLRAEDEA